ncbi:MAG: hypothetical protein QOH12_3781 [Solirubrobacteraceae bacterium]|jgi:hypothetical protein|nr:hypothetical protein [Solirubrobacteraceae bacterium]
MNELIKIRDVEVLEGHWLRLSFSDGAIKDVDLSQLLAAGRVFAPIRDRREVFERVRINPETQTIEWPGEVDLDPDVLYGSFEPASGVHIARRTVREPTGAHA